MGEAQICNSTNIHQAMNPNLQVHNENPVSAYPLAKLFLASVALILIVTSLAKVISAFGRAALLETPDPLLSLSYRNLMMFAAAAELLVLSMLISKCSVLTKVISVSWVACVFAAYRAAAWLVGADDFCPCLGGLADAIRLSPSAASKVLTGTLIYMIMGSLAILPREWKAERLTSPNATTTSPAL